MKHQQPIKISNAQRTSKVLKAIFCASALLLASCASFSSAPKQTNYGIKSSGDAAVDKQAQAFKNVQLWGAAYEKDPNSPLNIIGYAKSLTAINNEAQALKVLKQGEVKFPKDAGIMRTHGKLLSKRGLVGPALRKMQEALKYSPNDWHLYNDIGELHSKMGEQALAIDSFKRALKLSPNNPVIHTNMGVTYMFNKQLKLAEKHLAIAVKHPKATAKMRQNYAFALGLQGKYSQARKVFLQDLTLAQVDDNIEQLKQLNSQK